MRMFLSFIGLLGFSTSIFASSDSVFSSVITSISSSYETMLFIGVILGLLVLFCTNKKFKKIATTSGPEILTTIGILGCFFGIALALLDFNTKDVTESIPSLLAGIRTAFWSSICGIGSAIILKFKHHWHSTQSDHEANHADASIGDMIAEIINLKKALSGDEEGTLLSQLKLLRQDSNDRQEQLKNSFDDFAKHMVENNQKAFIEALKEAIRDFNHNLTEQFGENFKQLNQAVEQLVTWQVQYKEELDLIKQYQSQTATDMKQASEAFKDIVDRSKHFADIAQDLKILLESMSKQKDLLFIQEKALSELLTSMKDHIPEFSESTRKMLNEISDGVSKVQNETAQLIANYSIEMKSMNDSLKTALANVVQETHTSLSERIQESTKIVQGNVTDLQAQTVDILKNHSAQLQSTQAEIKNVLVSGLNKSQQEVSAGLQEHAKIIEKGVLALDKELEKSLTDALDSLGKQLASLSEKFVQDYLPLTERLRDVVRLAKNLEAA